MLAPFASSQSQQLPVPPSASSAVANLKRLRFLPAQDAIARLATLADTGRILWLYRRHFPRAYARSTASAQILISQVGECGYSEREKEFFTLVDQHLFPMPDLFFEESRFDVIPIYPQGVDWDDDLEYLRLSLRAGMELIQGEDSPFWAQWLPANLRPIAGDHAWKRFERDCRRAGGLKSLFPQLIELVSHDTGNMWLDISWEMGVQDVNWTEEDMKALTLEWRRARRYLDKLEPLLARIDKHPRYWLTELVRLWNASLKMEGRRR